MEDSLRFLRKAQYINKTYPQASDKIKAEKLTILCNDDDKPYWVDEFENITEKQKREIKDLIKVKTTDRRKIK